MMSNEGKSIQIFPSPPSVYKQYGTDIITRYYEYLSIQQHTPHLFCLFLGGGNLPFDVATDDLTTAPSPPQPPSGNEYTCFQRKRKLSVRIQP